MNPNPPESHDNLESLIKSIRLIAFDFDGVFTDNRVYVFEDGREAVACSRSDGIGLRKLDRLGIHTIVISTETNPVVSERCRKLEVRCRQGIEDKLSTLSDIASRLSVALSEIAFVGNDINDLDCLKAVALPIVVNDSHADVLSHGLYRTSARGGYGAVREVCDLFERILDTPA